MSKRRNQSQQDGGREVSVYLRNSQKRALLAKLKMHIQYDQIHRIVSQKLRISDDKIIIFFKGERLIQNQRILLSEKCIIHVVNLEKVNKEYINIQIKRIEGQKIIHKFKLQPKTTIKEFINGQMYEVFNQNSEEIFLVYTGKQIDINKTFQEELVEDQSELLCVRLDQSQFQVSSSNLSNHSQNNANLLPTVKNTSIQHQSKQKTHPQIQLRTYVQNFLKRPISPSQNEINQAQTSENKSVNQQIKEVVLKNQPIYEQQKKALQFLNADTLLTAINIQSFNPIAHNNYNFNQPLNWNSPYGFDPQQTEHNLKTSNQPLHQLNTNNHISNGIANQFLNFYQIRQQDQIYHQQVNHKDHPYTNREQCIDLVQNKQQSKANLSYEGRQQYERDNQQQTKNHLSEEQNNINLQDHNEQDEGEQRRVIHFFFQQKRQNPPTKIIKLQDEEQIHSQSIQAIPNQITNPPQNFNQNEQANIRQKLQAIPCRQQYQFEAQARQNMVNYQQNANPFDPIQNQVYKQHLYQQIIGQNKAVLNTYEDKLNKLNCSPPYQQTLQQNPSQNCNHNQHSDNNGRPQQEEQQHIIQQQIEVSQANKQKIDQSLNLNKGKINIIIPEVIHQMSNPHINTFKNAFNKLKNKKNVEDPITNMLPSQNNPIDTRKQGIFSHNLAIQQEQLPKFNSSDSLPSNDQLPRQKLLLNQILHKQQHNAIREYSISPSEQNKNQIQKQQQKDYIERRQRPLILDFVSYNLNANNKQPQYNSSRREQQPKQELNKQQQDQNLLFQQQPLIQSTPNHQKFTDQQANLNTQKGHITKDRIHQQAQFIQNHQNLMQNQEGDDNEQQFQMVQVANQQNIQFKAGDLIYSGEMNINNSENLMKNIIEEYSHLLRNNEQGSINAQR